MTIAMATRKKKKQITVHRCHQEGVAPCSYHPRCVSGLDWLDAALGVRTLLIYATTSQVDSRRERQLALAAAHHSPLQGVVGANPNATVAELPGRRRNPKIRGAQIRV